MMTFDREKFKRILKERGGKFRWLWRDFRKKLEQGEKQRSKLALLDRIALAPRQSLVLVEAEGRRILVATSPDGGPAFFALDNTASAYAVSERRNSRRLGSRTQPVVPSRVSW